MEQIKAIKDLIECYRKLPGIGSRTAERLAYATLNFAPETRTDFIKALEEVNLNVKKCPNCGTFFEDVCPICADTTRDKTIMMVVSDSKDILPIEKTNGFQGTYFSLKGTIAPLKNRTPGDIGIPELKQKVIDNNVKELILALPTDLDGETTAMYIANLYKNSDIAISKLANGIPIGTNLEYLDNLTISSSIRGRISLKGDEKHE